MLKLKKSYKNRMIMFKQKKRKLFSLKEIIIKELKNKTADTQ